MESLSKVLGDASKSTRPAQCEKHGEFTSTLLFGNRVWSRCPTCQSENDRQREEEEKAKALQQAQDRHKALLGRAAIPQRFIGRTFDGFTATTDAQKKALFVCRDYAEQFKENHKAGMGLILSGKPGTGKSHLASAIMQTILGTHTTQYVTCMDVIRMIRETWRKDSERSERRVLESLGHIDLLVIDEIGVQYGTEGEQTILFDVLDIRYRDQMPTILLTNQDMAGARQFLGDRTWDRIRETGRWVSFDWESFRPQARKEAEK